MKSRVVVAAIIEKEGKILLGQKPKDIGPYPNTWHLPGGGVHLDDESLEEAIKREIREECGIQVDSMTKISFDEDIEPDKHGEPTRYLFLTYKVRYVSGDVKASDDIIKLRWFSYDMLTTIPLTRPSQKLFKTLGLI
jgi:8-oxo-dGTP diphosphatase